MSDPPPKPKPGSLRDRIAAFEKPQSGSGGGGGGGPPPPRPKPGGLTWKPKPKEVTPPSSPGKDGEKDKEKAGGGGGGGGMSASDARQTIGIGGGSLKERMAALQGRGGFGGGGGGGGGVGATPSGPSSPKPDRPKWKPPVQPAPVAVEAEAEGEEKDEKGEDKVEKESKEKVDDDEKDKEEAPAPVTTEETPAEDAPSDAPADPEEEERQRRAAIAARMARLGGARVGMGPPVFGRPTIKKRDSTPTPREEKPKPNETFVSPNPVGGEKDIGEKKDGLDTTTTTQSPTLSDKSPSLLSPNSQAPSTSTSPHIPNVMPMSSIPRRAAPPRKRGKSPVPPPEPEKEKEEEKIFKETTQVVEQSKDEAEEKVQQIKQALSEVPKSEHKPQRTSEPEAVPKKEDDDAAARKHGVSERLAKSWGLILLLHLHQAGRILPSLESERGLWWACLRKESVGSASTSVASRKSSIAVEGPGQSEVPERKQSVGSVSVPLRKSSEVSVPERKGSLVSVIRGKGSEDALAGKTNHFDPIRPKRKASVRVVERKGFVDVEDAQAPDRERSLLSGGEEEDVSPPHHH
ncbi:assembly of actin patch protein [Marasmius sp. AFHP31]|nr:assembly of actin patch protein [Marasmius sp. AFHP31]